MYTETSTSSRARRMASSTVRNIAFPPVQRVSSFTRFQILTSKITADSNMLPVANPATPVLAATHSNFAFPPRWPRRFYPCWWLPRGRTPGLLDRPQPRGLRHGQLHGASSQHEKSVARRCGSLAVPRRPEHGGVPHQRHAGALLPETSAALPANYPRRPSAGCVAATPPPEAPFTIHPSASSTTRCP